MSDPGATLVASTTPVEDLDRLGYIGQKFNRRRYLSGFEDLFNQLPKIYAHDAFFAEKRRQSVEVFTKIKTRLGAAFSSFLKEIPVDPKDFTRTLLGMEAPHSTSEGELEGGVEVLTGKWSKGLHIPPHSHAAGFMYEEMLQGVFVDTVYHLVPGKYDTIRPSKTEVFTDSAILSDSYTDENPTSKFPALIHSVEVLEEATTLHLIPAHTRDGRGNMNYVVEHFDDHYFVDESNTTLVSIDEFMQAQPEEVYLVCPEAVPYLGAHFFVVTGGPVMKPHGLRPDGYAIGTPFNGLLDRQPRGELFIFRLEERLRRVFMSFHGIPCNKLPIHQYDHPMLGDFDY